MSSQRPLIANKGKSQITQDALSSHKKSQMKITQWCQKGHQLQLSFYGSILNTTSAWLASFMAARWLACGPQKNGFSMKEKTFPDAPYISGPGQSHMHMLKTSIGKNAIFLTLEDCDWAWAHLTQSTWMCREQWILKQIKVLLGNKSEAEVCRPLKSFGYMGVWGRRLSSRLAWAASQEPVCLKIKLKGLEI